MPRQRRTKQAIRAIMDLRLAFAETNESTIEAWYVAATFEIEHRLGAKAAETLKSAKWGRIKTDTMADVNLPRRLVYDRVLEGFGDVLRRSGIAAFDDHEVRSDPPGSTHSWVDLRNKLTWVIGGFGGLALLASFWAWGFIAGGGGNSPP